MAKKYAMVIVNPVAGGGSTRRKWEQISRQLTLNGLVFDYEFTCCQNHATELARTAADEGYRFLVAVGGDGTVNEVANGILTSSQPQNVTLGIINTGTGSDLIRTVGAPKDPLGACNFLSREDRFLIDIGEATFYHDGKKTCRYFVNYCGTGFDSEVAETTNRMPKPAFVPSTLPYLVALIRTLVRYRNHDIKLTVDGEVRRGRFLSVIVANGQYFGGGMRVAPHAKLDDGKLDVVTVEDIGKLELLKVFPTIYKGTHIYHPKVVVRQAKNIEVEPEIRMPVSADGELLGEGPVTFRIIPQALAIAR
jgi:diacylglycerol kinase (ATP)